MPTENDAACVGNGCAGGAGANGTRRQRGGLVTRKERYIVGLDVGTSKVAAIVGAR
jgi:hypothetical protein